MDNEWLSQTRNFSLNDNGETAVKIVPRFQLANIDRDVFTALTTRPEVTAKIAGMILEQCTNFNFDGAVIEVMAPSVFPDLVKAVSKALKAEGLDLILVIGPQRGDANDPTNFKREHFANLVDHVDAFSLMTYDFSHPKK